MRIALLVLATGLAAAFAHPASAETCLYLQKPGAPRHIVCTSGGLSDGCAASVGFTAECDGHCTVNTGYCGPGAECVVNAGTCTAAALDR